MVCASQSCSWQKFSDVAAGMYASEIFDGQRRWVRGHWRRWDDLGGFDGDTHWDIHGLSRQPNFEGWSLCTPARNRVGALFWRHFGHQGTSMNPGQHLRNADARKRRLWVSHQHSNSTKIIRQMNDTAANLLNTRKNKDYNESHNQAI